MSEDHKKGAPFDGHDDELAELYQRSREPSPPSELDKAILDAARARSDKTRPTPASHPTRWLTGIAATVIVGILIVQLYPETRRVEQPAPVLEEQIAPPAQLGRKPRISEDAPAPAGAGTESRLETERRADAPSAVVEDKADARPSADRPLGNFLLDGNAPRELTDPASPAAEDALAAWNSVVALYHAGRLEQARRAYREFRQTYPGFRIPYTDLDIVAELNK